MATGVSERLRGEPSISCEGGLHEAGYSLLLELKQWYSAHITLCPKELLVRAIYFAFYIA